MIRTFDGRQYGVLLLEGIRLTFTGSRGIGPGDGSEDGSRHLLGASYSLTLSIVVAGAVYTEAAPGPFLLVTFTLSAVFCAIALVGELAGGLLDPMEAAVTGHLPVSHLTRSAARFTELCLTLAILTLNFTLAPAILFFFKTGAPAAPLVCLALAFLLALFTASACFVLYAVTARFLSAVRLDGVLLYLNIMVSLGIMGLLLNMGRLLQGDILAAVAKGDWPPWFPPAWFASLALRALGLEGADTRGAWIAALAVPAALILLAAAARSSWNGRARHSRRRGKSAPGPIMRLFQKAFVSEGERAAFEFTSMNLARDKGFRLKAYPILGVPILIMTMSLQGTAHPLFLLFMLHLMNLYLFLVLSFLPFGDHFMGAWIFDALPLKGPAAFARGAQKAFVFRIALPLFVLNAAVLSLVWSPAAGAPQAFCAFLAGLLGVKAGFRGMTAYPFSREFKGSVSSTFHGSLFALVFLFGGLAWIQYALRESPALFCGLVAALAVISFLWWRRP